VISAVDAYVKDLQSQLTEQQAEIERLQEPIDSTANMMRGMSIDPALPLHAKEALYARSRQLDDALKDQP
jgi:argininosuccinate lyase